MMDRSTFKTLPTSLTATTFLVVGLSGVMLYFHFGEMFVKQLHEIVGLGFVVAALWHVMMNWSSMRRYFGKRTFLLVTGIIIALSSVMIYQASSEQKSNPQRAIIESVLHAPTNTALTVLCKEPQIGYKILEKNGIKGLDKESLYEIAQYNHLNPFKLVVLLTK